MSDCIELSDFDLRIAVHESFGGDLDLDRVDDIPHWSTNDSSATILANMWKEEGDKIGHKRTVTVGEDAPHFTPRELRTGNVLVQFNSAGGCRHS